MELKLTQKDKEIICGLDLNARTTWSKLASQLRLSKQAVRYRIEQLEKKGIIQFYYALVDGNRFGYSIYLLYLKLHRITPDKEKEMVAHLEAQPETMVMVKTNGRWDYNLIISAKDAMHFHQIFNRMTLDYVQYIKEMIFTIEIEATYLKPKFLSESAPFSVKTSGKISQADLDEVDSHILTELSKNARKPLVELAAETKLTPNGVRERIRRLEKEKFILAYLLKVNYESLGYLHFRVFLHIDNFSPQLEKEIKNFLAQMKQVISISKTIGFAELEFRAYTKSVTEFYEILDKIRQRFQPFIRDTDTLLYHAWHNFNYLPSVSMKI